MSELRKIYIDDEHYVNYDDLPEDVKFRVGVYDELQTKLDAALLQCNKDAIVVETMRATVLHAIVNWINTEAEGTSDNRE